MIDETETHDAMGAIKRLSKLETMINGTNDPKETVKKLFKLEFQQLLMKYKATAYPYQWQDLEQDLGIGKLVFEIDNAKFEEDSSFLL